jgi:phosphatidylserine/phosphatidylglycerophosphate/cardiolipin synthase-like enzyme
MQREEVDTILLSTLSDFRLSKVERDAIKATIRDLQLNDEGRRFWRNRAFALAEATVNEGRPDEVLDWLHDVVKAIGATTEDTPASVQEAYFSPGEACRRRISSFINGARSALDICVFTITDNDLARHIERAHERQIRVRIITDDDKSNDRGSDIDKLVQVGVPIRVDRTHAHMHHKFAIADGSQILTGSYNWTRSAARENEENIVVSNDPELVSAFTREFEQLWRSLRWAR